MPASNQTKRTPLIILGIVSVLAVLALIVLTNYGGRLKASLPPPTVGHCLGGLVYRLPITQQKVDACLSRLNPSVVATCTQGFINACISQRDCLTKQTPDLQWACIWLCASNSCFYTYEAPPDYVSKDSLLRGGNTTPPTPTP